MANKGSRIAITLCLIVSLLVLSIGKVEANCWKDWSRCSPGTSFATGILWKSCNNRCIKLGFSRGECVPSPSHCPLLRNNKQCQCYKEQTDRPTLGQTDRDTENQTGRPRDTETVRL